MDNSPQQKQSTSQHADPKKGTTPSRLKYAYEFLVIFLAVFLGFLADEYREGLAEDQKERQYAEGLVRNLRGDSVSLVEFIELNKKKFSGLNTFLEISGKDFTKQENLRQFYKLAWASRMYEDLIFRSYEATITQLKSTGDMRLMRRGHVADSIFKYDIDVQYMKEFELYYRNHMEETWRTMYALSTDLSNIVDVLNDKGNPAPLVNDPRMLGTYFNLVRDFSWTTNGYVGRLEAQLQSATRLIRLLEKEYDLR